MDKLNEQPPALAAQVQALQDCADAANLIHDCNANMIQARDNTIFDLDRRIDSLIKEHKDQRVFSQTEYKSLNIRVESLIKANDTHIEVRKRLTKENALHIKAMDEMRDVALGVDVRCNELKGENDVLGAKVAVLERRCKNHRAATVRLVHRVKSMRRALQAKNQVIAGIKRFLKTTERKS